MIRDIRGLLRSGFPRGEASGVVHDGAAAAEVFGLGGGVVGTADVYEVNIDASHAGAAKVGGDEIGLAT